MILAYGLNRHHTINWRTGTGRTLDYQLDWAVPNDHVARAKLLVEHGADATRRLGDGTTLSAAAMLAGHPDLAEFLVTHGAKRPRLDLVDRFTCACMATDAAAARDQLRQHPDLPRGTSQPLPGPRKHHVPRPSAYALIRGDHPVLRARVRAALNRPELSIPDEISRGGERTLAAVHVLAQAGLGTEKHHRRSIR